MITHAQRMTLLTVRFLLAVDTAREQWSEAAEMDAAFDAGEWSGPACERMFNAEVERTAQRFGFVNSAVAYTVAHLLNVTRDDFNRNHEFDPEVGFAFRAPLPH